jgi:predicted nucleic acid-binding protein
MTGSRLLSDRPPVYGVDTMLFVYHFEGNQEFGPAAGRILKAAEEGQVRLVTSVLSLLEVLVIPKRYRRQDLCQRYREFFTSFPNLRTLSVQSEIAEIASGLRADHELRTPDSIHMATAVHAGADAFVTQDFRLKKIRTLPVLSLQEVL